MLRTAFNIHWQEHVTNKELYGELPKVSDKIRERRTRFAGHCTRSSKELASSLILWKPKHGHKRPGRQQSIYIDILRQDTGLDEDDMKNAMLDRRIWRAITIRETHST